MEQKHAFLFLKKSFYIKDKNKEKNKDGVIVNKKDCE